MRHFILTICAALAFVACSDSIGPAFPGPVRDAGVDSGIDAGNVGNPFPCEDSEGDIDDDGICTNDDMCYGDNSLGDADEDGICDSPFWDDNCFGDDRTGDDDDDGVCNNLDLCEGIDDFGYDTDEDGYPDVCDNCPGVDDGIDEDGDGFGDECDICDGDDESGDSDEDGICDDIDLCIGIVDSDQDGDGICDDIDLCEGDDATGDSDGDGVCDIADVCDGDDATGDSDGDDICDDIDPCDGLCPLPSDCHDLLVEGHDFGRQIIYCSNGQLGEHESFTIDNIPCDVKLGGQLAILEGDDAEVISAYFDSLTLDRENLTHYFKSWFYWTGNSPESVTADSNLCETGECAVQFNSNGTFRIDDITASASGVLCER